MTLGQNIFVVLTIWYKADLPQSPSLCKNDFPWKSKICRKFICFFLADQSTLTWKCVPNFVWQRIIAVGVVLKLPKLAAQKLRPETIIANLKAHPGIAPLVGGGEIKEYSAHVIPEAGLAMMPKLAGDGLLVSGDAAAMCLAAGIWLEGVNFAMASGMYAAEAAAEALAANDMSVAGLAGYERRLNDTFVLRDHRKLRRAPSLVLSDRVQHLYPHMIANTVERMFRVDNPTPKPGLRRILNEERKRAGVKLKDLASDALDGLRSFG